MSYNNNIFKKVDNCPCCGSYFKQDWQKENRKRWMRRRYILVGIAAALFVAILILIALKRSDIIFLGDFFPIIFLFTWLGIMISIHTLSNDAKYKQPKMEKVEVDSVGQ